MFSLFTNIKATKDRSQGTRTIFVVTSNLLKGSFQSFVTGNIEYSLSLLKMSEDRKSDHPNFIQRLERHI